MDLISYAKCNRKQQQQHVHSKKRSWYYQIYNSDKKTERTHQISTITTRKKQHQNIFYVSVGIDTHTHSDGWIEDTPGTAISVHTNIGWEYLAGFLLFFPSFVNIFKRSGTRISNGYVTVLCVLVAANNIYFSTEISHLHWEKETH